MISIDRVLEKLDEYLHRNDYASAERHLSFWLSEARAERDGRAEILVQNERMGIYRKLARRDEALRVVDEVLSKIDEMGISYQVGAATTYLNAATVYCAFGMAEQGISLFEKAREIYEAELDGQDRRLGGLYNNMGLTLVELGRFAEARELYGKAISVMLSCEGGEAEAAITHLNLATAAEKEFGLLDADERISDHLDRAEELLECVRLRDGNYAFACEKCATVFHYYGRFSYGNELAERARRIYEQRH
ncbi:MAG: tetratricopeptide repeat protein [Clostridia bacterium]|nr:tetratricopeptide repeat protein [Clostridia bacterium]